SAVAAGVPPAFSLPRAADTAGTTENFRPKMHKQSSVLISTITLAISVAAQVGPIDVNQTASEHKHEQEKEKKQKYTCPMHPEVVTENPGNCPKCGMKLVPVAQEKRLAPNNDHMSHQSHTSHQMHQHT